MRVGIVASIAIAACGPRGGGTIPNARPELQLVECAAATPPPQLGAPEALEEGRRDRDPVLFRLASTGRRVVTLGSVSAPGGDPARIAAVIRAKLPELSRCYASEGPLRAAIVYKLAVGLDGKVRAVEPAAAVLTGAIRDCVRRVLGSLVFPTRGAAFTVTVPLVFDSTDAKKPPPARPVLAWTPFAIDAGEPTAAAGTAARATESALQKRMATLDRCFANPTPRGSLRVMLELDAAGDLDGLRVGGLGDAGAEACIAKALEGLHVVTAHDEHVEVACDLARGNARSWRVAPSAGYRTIVLERAQVRSGDQTVVPGATDPEPLPPATYLVIARPDSPGAMIQLALLWAGDAHAVVLALADDQPAPLYLGVGLTSIGDVDDVDDTSVHPAMRVNGETASACVGRTTQTAKLSDAAAIGALVNELARKCHAMRCAPTLVVAIDSDAVAKDLREIAGAARRAGFDRVLFGGSELGCSAPAPARRTISGPDFDAP